MVTQKMKTYMDVSSSLNTRFSLGLEYVHEGDVRITDFHNYIIELPNAAVM